MQVICPIIRSKRSIGRGCFSYTHMRCLAILWYTLFTKPSHMVCHSIDWPQCTWMGVQKHIPTVVADQCSKRALVFVLVAPSLEQILLGSKHLIKISESEGHDIFSGKTRRWELVYRCTLCAKIFLFRRQCNRTQKPTPEIIDYRPKS